MTTNDIDIDQIWSTFRLPVPLHQETDSPSRLPSYCSDEWVDKMLDLLGLIHIMKEQRKSDEETLLAQIRMAQSSLHDIECNFVPMLNSHRQQVDSMDELQLNFHLNMDVLLNELRTDTTDVCEANRIKLDQLRQDKKDVKRDLIAEIFFMPEDQSPLFETNQSDDEYDLKLSDDEKSTTESNREQSHAQRTPQSSSKKSTAPPTKAHHSSKHQYHDQQQEIDPVAFQKEQQFLLESELSELATRLKSSTLAMNATLQSQSRELEDFENLAQRNLDTVSSTAGQVEDRLVKKNGWKKRLGTWSLIFTIVGVWILCFMVIRTIPKRKIEKMNLSFSPFDKWSLSSWLHETNNYHEEEEDYTTDEMYAEQERRQREMLREQTILQEEEQRRRNEQKTKQQQHMDIECEILSDGTQRCPGDGQKEYYNDNSDRRAQDHAAERKRSRIEENIANAQIVNAVDIDEAVEERRRLEELARIEEQQRLRMEAETLAAVEAQRRWEEAERHYKIEEEANFQSEAEAPVQREMQQQEAIAEEKQHIQDDEVRQQIEQAEQHHILQEEVTATAEEQAQGDWDTVTAQEQDVTRQQEERITTENDAEKEKQHIQDEEVRRQIEQAEQHRTLQEEATATAEEQAQVDWDTVTAQEQEVTRQQEERITTENDAEKEKQHIQDEEVRRQIEQAEQHRILQEEATATAEEQAQVDWDTVTAQEQDVTHEQEERIITENDAETQASSKRTILPSDIRYVARHGNNELLAQYISQQPEMIDASDGSGWRALHEAARGGNIAGLQLLIDSGSDLSARTGRGGTGGTALWWAIQRYGEDSDIVRLLRSYDAPEDGPEL